VLLPGRLERHGGDSGVAWVDTPGDEQVSLRVSRGGGLPSWLPDVHGLAVRHADGDLLLSGTGTAPLLRHVLAPRRRPGRATYGSLLPFRGPRGPVLLAAIPLGAYRWPRDLDALAATLRVQPMVLAMVWARPLGPWRVFGRLTLTAPDDGPARGADPHDADLRAGADLRFDPADTPEGLATYVWVARVRTPAYVTSQRHGPRDAQHHRPGTPGTDESGPRDRAAVGDRRDP
jgi:hypothetical protein